MYNWTLDNPRFLKILKSQFLPWIFEPLPGAVNIPPPNIICTEVTFIWSAGKLQMSHHASRSLATQICLTRCKRTSLRVGKKTETHTRHRKETKGAAEDRQWCRQTEREMKTDAETNVPRDRATKRQAAIQRCRDKRRTRHAKLRTQTDLRRITPQTNVVAEANGNVEDRAMDGCRDKRRHTLWYLCTRHKLL